MRRTEQPHLPRKDLHLLTLSTINIHYKIRRLCPRREPPKRAICRCRVHEEYELFKLIKITAVDFETEGKDISHLRRDDAAEEYRSKSNSPIHRESCMSSETPFPAPQLFEGRRGAADILGLFNSRIFQGRRKRDITIMELATV